MISMIYCEINFIYLPIFSIDSSKFFWKTSVIPKPILSFKGALNKKRISLLNLLISC